MTAIAPGGQGHAAFAAAYARHRAAEGRALGEADLLRLPYLTTGPLARQWRVRARSFDTFAAKVLDPFARRQGRPVRLLDLGAGNGWLSYRVALRGHQAIALDIRDDAVDGLGAIGPYRAHLGGRIEPIVAPFEAIPLPDRTIDIALFNASLHYAADLAAVLREAARTVRPGGLLAILDTPFYMREEDGRAMVAEKHAQAGARMGADAAVLLQPAAIEFLTAARLAGASQALALDWRRHGALYPLWYELRPLRAALRGARRPSRFDVWAAVVP